MTKKSKLKVAIIDGNNIAFGAYQQFYKGKSGLLQTSMGIPTTIIFGMVRTLANLVENLKFDRCVVCWDIGGGSKYRKSIWPDYKAERKKSKPPFPMEPYYEELDEVRNSYFKKLGISQASVKGIEADDVIGWMARKLSKHYRVTIVSNDKDYYQMMDGRIKLWRPIVETLVDQDWVEEKFLITGAKNYAKMLALMGDKDEVPGIFGLGEVAAAKMLDAANYNLGHAVKTCPKEYSTKKDGKKKLLKDLKPSRSLAYKMARIRTRDKDYDEWELTGLKKALKRFKKPKRIKKDTIVYLQEFLEFEKVNLFYIMKKIGVRVEGKQHKGVKV